MLLRYIKCAKTIRFIILKLPVEKQKKNTQNTYEGEGVDSKLKNKRQTNKKKNSKKQKQLFKI